MPSYFAFFFWKAFFGFFLGGDESGYLFKGPTVEKLTIISTSYTLSKAKAHRREMKELNFAEEGAPWGDEDNHFNLELDNFGVDLNVTNNTPTYPKTVICCWIEKSAERQQGCSKHQVAQKIQ